MGQAILGCVVKAIVIAVMLALPALAMAQGSERVSVPVPQGYVLGNAVRTADGGLQEYVPVGQSVQAWSHMLTVRDFPSLAGVDPEQFHLNVVQQLYAVCPDAVHEVVFSGLEAGGRVHLLLAGCPRSPVTGGEEWFLSKAMGGQGALYNVQGAWRGPATRELVEGWSAYLRQVGLCDPARADRPCAGP